jgi:hypothetical protein
LCYYFIDRDVQEEFEDTKGVIRIRKSWKGRQHNDQKKKDKRTNNNLHNIHIKLKIELTFESFVQSLIAASERYNRLIPLRDNLMSMIGQYQDCVHSSNDVLC